MKEANLLRLVQAFTISRIVYVTPFLALKTDERQKINNIIKRAHKQALGIPITAPNSKFEAMGVHNTLEELREAQRTGKLERLAKSITGRHILNNLGITYEAQQGQKIDIPAEQRARLHIPPLPMNMHPVHNEDRRMERARALHRRFERSDDVVYVDAAEYRDKDAMAIAVVDSQGHSVSSGTVRTDTPEVVEEAAIALALASTHAKFIVSDSKSAIRNFTRGRISPEAHHILKGFTGTKLRGVQIVWAPAHSALPGNDNAHEAARGLSYRDCLETPELSLRLGGRDRMVAYREIITHYRLGRIKYPAPHSTLNSWQSVAWRLLQSNSFPSPLTYSYCYPGLYDNTCKLCSERADLAHILWACPLKDTSKPPAINIATPEQWETVLLSSDPDVQLRAVQMAEDAARTQGLLAAV